MQLSKLFIPLHSFKRRKFEAIECGVEQLVARRAHNPKVARSSRVPATKLNEDCRLTYLDFIQFVNQRS